MSQDRSYLYGDGLFETVRVEESGPIALERHVARFSRSAAALGYPDACVHAGISALNALRAAEPGIHRVTIAREDDSAPFAGHGGVSVNSRPVEDAVRPRLIALRGWYFPGDTLREHKSTSYLRSVEARRLACARGADDALLVDGDGFIGEASTSNVFVEMPSGLVTPPVRGILPGVTRERILERFDVIVRPVHVDELQFAREIILTNAAQIALAALEFESRSLTHYRALDFIEDLS